MAFTSALSRFLSGHATHEAAGEEFFDELTDALIEGDVLASVAAAMTDELAKECRGKSESEVRSALAKMIGESVSGVELRVEEGKTNIWMLLGVNGVGKTTACAKIANMFRARGYEGAGRTIILAAADTFRAAAIEQLEMHGERIGLRVVRHQMNSDPSAVVYDAANAAAAAGGGLVIADTAGRLHNKEGLVRELQKINKTCLSRSSEGCCKKLLVLDATTGQNAVRQAEVFHEAIGVDAIVLTKCDALSKGGCIITIGQRLHIPVAFVCYGEDYSAIKLFNKEEFVREAAGI